MKVVEPVDAVEQKAPHVGSRSVTVNVVRVVVLTEKSGVRNSVSLALGFESRRVAIVQFVVTRSVNKMMSSGWFFLPSVTRFGEISPILQNFKRFWQIFYYLFLIWQNVVLNLLHNWGHFNCCKWTNILTIWSHCSYPNFLSLFLYQA